MFKTSAFQNLTGEIFWRVEEKLSCAKIEELGSLLNLVRKRGDLEEIEATILKRITLFLLS